MRALAWTAALFGLVCAAVPLPGHARGPAPTRPAAPPIAAPADLDVALADSNVDDLPDPFSIPPARRDDPYGPRPEGTPVLTLEQIERYALGNPLVRVADEQIASMQAKVRKAKFAWVPVIDTAMALTPGVNIVCDDIPVPAGGAQLESFQFCRPGGDPTLDVQTASGYFSQLGRAGVRFSFQLDTAIPIYTFGKLKNVRKMAEVGLALTKLQKVATLQESLLRVRQAHATLELARASITILRESKKVLDQARARMTKNLGSEDDFDAEPTDEEPIYKPDDPLRLELAEADVDELMLAALKVESLALSALWALAGDAAPRGFDVDVAGITRVELEGGRRTLAHYKEEARQHRPEARMADAAIQLRKAQERLARSNFLPDLGVTLSVGVARTSAADSAMSALYYVDNFNYSRVTAALAMRWRFDFHNDAFDLQGARADLRAARYQREAADLLLGREVEEAYADLVEADAIERLRVKSAAAAWRLVVSHQVRETAGNPDSVELLRALEQWYRRRFSQVEAVAQHNIAAARLARAVGAPLWGTQAR